MFGRERFRIINRLSHISQQAAKAVLLDLYCRYGELTYATLRASVRRTYLLIGVGGLSVFGILLLVISLLPDSALFIVPWLYVSVLAFMVVLIGWSGYVYYWTVRLCKHYPLEHLNESLRETVRKLHDRR
jgi:hypothetical protein